MNLHDKEAFSAFAAQLRRFLPGAALWAFGSRARGDAAPDSDLDVCVVVDLLDRPTRNLIRDVAWEIGFAHDVVITTVKYTRDAFEHGPASVSPLVQTVLREGVAA
jgi:predicted nucleotidyltransferase